MTITLVDLHLAILRVRRYMSVIKVSKLGSY